jgi:hypothetical protein
MASQEGHGHGTHDKGMDEASFHEAFTIIMITAATHDEDVTQKRDLRDELVRKVHESEHSDVRRAPAETHCRVKNSNN